MNKESITLGMDIEVTNWNPNQFLDLSVYLNDIKIYENDHVQGFNQIRTEEYDIEEDQEHVLKLVINGMKPEYTVIDNQGKITDDVLCIVKNVYLDDIPLDYLAYKKGVYRPEWKDNHETGPEVIHEVDHMGINGEWSITFESPIYLWLLENM